MSHSQTHSPQSLLGDIKKKKTATEVIL